MKKLTRLLILFLIPLLLCSCWDFKDINKKAVVLSDGIDYNGTTDNYIFSGEANNFSTPARSQEGGETNIFKYLSQGRTFEEAQLRYYNTIPMPIFFGGTVVVIFGKSLAIKSIEPYLNRIDGIIDYRKTALAVVSKETPEQLFNIKTDKAISVGTSIQENLEWLTDDGKAIYTTIGEMLSAIAIGNVGYVVPYVGFQNKDIRYLGLAVMKDSKLIDIIDISNTDGLLYLIADKPVLSETLPGIKNPKNIFSFHSKFKKRKIKTEYVDNTPVINVNLELILELHYQYYVEPISKKEIKQLEDILSDKIQTDIQEIVIKSQKEYQCDIFNFVKYFRADCPKAYKSIDWKEAYPTAKVNIEVSTKIINLNLYDPEGKVKTLEGNNE